MYRLVYMLGTWGILLRFAARKRDFTLLQSVQTDFWSQSPSYPVGTEDCFNYDNAAEAESSSLISIQCWSKECMELYCHAPICLLGFRLRKRCFTFSFRKLSDTLHATPPAIRRSDSDYTAEDIGVFYSAFGCPSHTPGGILVSNSASSSIPFRWLVCRFFLLA